jgi:hypothetical protein
MAKKKVDVQDFMDALDHPLKFEIQVLVYSNQKKRTLTTE